MSRKLTRDVAGQMAGLRKKFRGGRPVKPGRVRAAACPVLVPRRQRRIVSRLQCASGKWRSNWQQFSLKRRYPKWKYHRIQPAVIVQDPQAEAALGEEWRDRPFPNTSTIPAP